MNDSEWISRLLETSILDWHGAERPRLDHIYSKILSPFQENKYHSVRSFAQNLDVSLSTVDARLTDVLGFSLRHTRWISHLLTDEPKATRVATSMKMFELLEQEELIYFAGIIRGDESWFSLAYSRNHVWRLGNENALERISQKIDTDKHMLTIFWSTTGPLVRDWLATNASFNRTYFCEVIAPRLTSAAFRDQAGQCKRRVYLHLDNARLQNQRKPLQCVADNKFKRMFHPPYFPDIAPSDFYLFGTAKQRPQTCQGQSFDELQEKVHEILSFPEPDELEATMRAWMERLRRVIALSGE